MKHDSIKSDFRANLSGIVYILLVFTLSISFAGCSSGIEQSNTSNQLNIVSDKSFSFNDQAAQIGEWILTMMKFLQYIKMEHDCRIKK